MGPETGGPRGHAPDTAVSFTTSRRDNKTGQAECRHRQLTISGVSEVRVTIRPISTRPHVPAGMVTDSLWYATSCFRYLGHANIRKFDTPELT